MFPTWGSALKWPLSTNLTIEHQIFDVVSLGNLAEKSLKAMRKIGELNNVKREELKNINLSGFIASCRICSKEDLNY